MGWQELISRVLLKMTGAPTAPAKALAPDAWNYMLAQQLASRGLDNPARQPKAVLAAAQTAFPALTQVAGEAVLHQLDAVQRRAYDLGSAVNRQALTEAAAAQQLQQEFPQLTQANLNQLLVQSLLGTR